MPEIVVGKFNLNGNDGWIAASLNDYRELQHIAWGPTEDDARYRCMNLMRAAQ